MNKTFTLTFLKSIFKAVLIVAVIILPALSSPANASSVGYSNELPVVGIQAKMVKCYPNPAVSFINFDFPSMYVSKNYTLQVYSFTGRKMAEMTIKNEKSTLTFTNDFYRGIYIYQVRDSDGKVLESGKFQVTR